MMKEIRNVLCYSQCEFEMLMEKNGFVHSPGASSSVISICSKNDEYGSSHWFSEDVHTTEPAVFNLDIDDCDPFWFGTHGECYDKALELYNDGRVKESCSYFSHLLLDRKDNERCTMLHVIDYEESFELVRWIDDRIRNHGNIIYVHCHAGVSRSQGVVRYVLDTYGNDFDIRTNPSNPCLCPNAHVVMMLKRAYRLFKE